MLDECETETGGCACYYDGFCWHFGLWCCDGRAMRILRKTFVNQWPMCYERCLKVAILLKGNYTTKTSGVGSSGGEEPQGPSPCRPGLPIWR